ncbi:hypothetical protein Q765_14810 [Flavobacterium rivuli WB 3.3-2 = DSM 21788]|uniref:Uncharacterized protein n=1 Tax=Flavobacterium rivuli WB 3.3-2 = DSM 21788 TaxID=1121895 RepID=A0A0A2M288_9FLAO|nr:hypothetical protein [Flavobacterium rivuli]KGO85691.1 hypothetical protein Q765_14810 [Flavobacterium rivuli WB 3.3-2 = DSM 21788]
MSILALMLHALCNIFLVVGRDVYFFTIGRADKSKKNEPILGSRGGYKEMSLHSIKISGDGIVTQKELISNDDAKFTFMPKKGVVTTPGTFYCLGRNDKERQLLKITF